jgi:hypothetical protein
LRVLISTLFSAPAHGFFLLLLRFLGDHLVMASFLRIALVAVLVSSAMGFALGAMPSQTAGPETLVQGMGQPAFPAPTDAPSLELVRARMQKRAVTNVCTEWTIPGGLLLLIEAWGNVC